MKKIILLSLLIWANMTLFAQLPDWAINLPKPNNPTMDYLVGVGEGATFKEAQNEAFNDILRKLIVRFRLSVNSNDIMNAVYRNESLTAISQDYNLPPMREVCSYQVKQYGRERVYLLYQIAADGMITNPQFETFNKCDNDSRNGNKYIAWGIAGSGYPWNLVSGLEFRYGKNIGVGAYLDFGMDFTAITVGYLGEDTKAHTTKTSFRYAGGIKFFPYKGLFIDCGYGTIALPKEKILSYKYYGDGLTSDEATSIREKATKTSNGILFHAGYNLVTNLQKGVGFFMGVSAGASYDVHNKVFAPSVNLKIGVAWGIK